MTCVLPSAARACCGQQLWPELLLWVWVAAFASRPSALPWPLPLLASCLPPVLPWVLWQLCFPCMAAAWKFSGAGSCTRCAVLVVAV